MVLQDLFRRLDVGFSNRSRMGVGGRRRYQVVVFVESYPCSASVFKQGTLFIGFAVSRAMIFDDAMSINIRIPLVFLRPGTKV